jgi:type VI secretion system protein ImpA
VLLVRALSHLQGYKGLSDGTRLVHGLLDRYFPTVYPQLDPEEGNDPTMRITAVAGLCAADILAALRIRPLIISRSFGPVSLRDFAVAAGNAAPTPDAPKLDLAAVEAAFQEVDLAALELAADTLKAITAHLAGIEAVFERETSGQGPELGALLDIARQAQHAVVSRLERRIGVAEPESGTDAVAQPGGATKAGTALSGDIRTRADVIRALDKICEYYAEFEPSSPIPLLLQRGKRLVSKNFLEIIRDMAPDGASQVESIAGKVDA